jgi:hypothetical protein
MDDEGNRPPVDDPHEFAALLLGCGANGDGESAAAIAEQVIACGTETTAATLAILVGAVETSGVLGRTAEHPTNPQQN